MNRNALRRALLGAATAALSAALLPAPAAAIELAVNPIRLRLDAGHPIQTLGLRNGEARALGFEARVLRWTMRGDGSWEQVASDDLLVQPLILSVPAKGSAQLRVGMLGALPEGQAYRVELQQLPTPAAEDSGTTLSLLMKFSLPVFVEAPDAAPAPALAPVAVDGGRLRLRLRNDGRAHLDPQKARLALLDAAGTVLEEADIEVGYVLAGAALPLSHPLPASLCRRAASVRLALEQPAGVLSAPMPAGDDRRCAP